MSAADHRDSLHPTRDRELTAGIVRREIRVGMSGADVATALGSPNIVTADSGSREVWVYDRIATEASYSYGNYDLSASASGARGFSTGLMLGLVSGRTGGGAGAAAVSQKTLTVIIRFGHDGRVESFAYHQSRF
jgi:outer membrane protein assembly factor BamE (lipoprotein component of BamABCDE complex)